jgi:hypothetical protein
LLTPENLAGTRKKLKRDASRADIRETALPMLAAAAMMPKSSESAVPTTSAYLPKAGTDTIEPAGSLRNVAPTE